MTTTTAANLFQVGDIVKPANDGLAQDGQVLRWSTLRGAVISVWDDCGEQRVQVRWFKKSPYATRLPFYFLEKA